MTSIRWVLCLFFAQVLFAANSQKPVRLCKWWVELKDKSGSPYDLDHPQDFLSARSLDRRARNGVSVSPEDIPVNPAYVQALRDAGYRIHGVSRWMNAVAIIADTAQALEVTKLPFVKKLTYLGRDISVKNKPNSPAKKRRAFPENREAESRFGQLGYSAVNLAPLYTAFLHHVGARGEGIWVAVMDGGFTNVDTMPFFDSVALDRRLWPGPDFVEHDMAVFESAQHGTAVLSVMASNLPGYFVGAAPEATYFLLKTEDTGGEYPVEEVNWILGAEWADSIGVDIINASLGYTSFTDTLLNHFYAELDGHTAIGSRGASIAAQKGMLIFNSAGNSGDEAWHYVGVPADAPGIVAVGATDSQDDTHASFSSYGPSADGRIKPDLSAPGLNVITAGSTGNELTVSAGTSIASPILAGSVAALWSDFPNIPARQILDTLYVSSDQSDRPDNEKGYGLPNFVRAWIKLAHLPVTSDSRIYGLDYETGLLKMLIFDDAPQNNANYSIKDVFGRVWAEGQAKVHGNSFKVLEIAGLNALPSGAWYLCSEDKTFLFGK